MKVGDVMTIRVAGQPTRRYLVTDSRPASPDSDELTLIADPEDDDGATVRYRAVRPQ